MPSFVVTPLSANVVQDANDDKPLILANHQLRDLSGSAYPSFNIDWRDSGGAVVNDSDFPTTRLYDNQSHLVSKPSGGDDTSFTLNFTFDRPAVASDLGLAEFDTIVLLGHNLSVCRTTQLQVANNSGFFLSAPITTWTSITDDKRRVSVITKRASDSGPQVISQVEFLRLKFTDTSAFTPEISEVIFGKRQQIRRHPLPPYSLETTASTSTLFSSESGITTRYTYNRGQALRSPKFVAYGADGDGGLEIDRFTGWWSECKQGTEPFIWIDEPSTVGTTADALYMDLNTEVFPFMRTPGPANTQRGGLDMSEKAPYFANEES
jgi:hypothetical protein